MNESLNTSLNTGLNTGFGSLAKPYRRALAVTLLLALLALLNSLLIAPWLEGAIAHGERMQERARLLEARQEMVDRIPLLEAKLKALKADPQSGKRLLQGASPASALTGLEAELRAILAATKAQIVSVEGLPFEGAAKREHAGPARVACRVILRGSEAMLAEALGGIERAVPFVYIEKMSLNNTASKVADVKAAQSHLLITLEIFGYWHNPP